MYIVSPLDKRFECLHPIRFRDCRLYKADVSFKQSKILWSKRAKTADKEGTTGFLAQFHVISFNVEESSKVVDFFLFTVVLFCIVVAPSIIFYFIQAFRSHDHHHDYFGYHSNLSQWWNYYCY